MEGLAPDRSTVGIDVAGLVEFWHILFAPAYGADMARQLTDLYRNETTVAPELSVYALDSDTGTACAIRELAKSGGTAFASPIYVGYVTGMPSHAPPSGPKFAYHGWDFKTATATWGGLCALCPRPQLWQLASHHVELVCHLWPTRTH